jgi:hypothetical protein
MGRQDPKPVSRGTHSTRKLPVSRETRSFAFWHFAHLRSTWNWGNRVAKAN